MKRFDFIIRDAKGGKIFDKGYVDALSRTEARELILYCARRDTPGGRGRSPRDYGYVPVSAYRIQFTREEVI